MYRLLDALEIPENYICCQSTNALRMEALMILLRWFAYPNNCLQNKGYQHLTVNHSLNFVDPDTGAHTPGIENAWWEVKRSMPRTGTSKDLFDRYLQEWLWRQHYKGDPFGNIIEHMANLYKVKHQTTLCDRIQILYFWREKKEADLICLCIMRRKESWNNWQNQERGTNKFIERSSLFADAKIHRLRMYKNKRGKKGVQV